MLLVKPHFTSLILPRIKCAVHLVFPKNERLQVTVQVVPLFIIQGIEERFHQDGALRACRTATKGIFAALQDWPRRNCLGYRAPIRDP